MLFWAGAIVVGLLWYLVTPAGFWFLSGAAGCFIVTLPMIIGRHQFEVVSPWSLVVLGAYVGFGVRGLFISLGINGSRSLEQLYFRGHEPDFFARPTAIFLIGLGLLAFGYIAAERRSPGPRPRLTARPHIRDSRVTAVVLVCAALGLAGFVLFALSTGGFDPTRISAKRTLISGAALDSSYQSHGELRVLNSFAPVALWLQLAWYASRRVPHGPTTLRFPWICVLFLNAAALPVYASTRADVVYIILGAVVVEYCLGGGRFRLGLAAGSVAAAVILAAAVGSLRGADDTSLSGVQVDSSGFVDTFILTRTFGDIPTAGNIINAVPERLPYAYGSTITAWAFAPVPRAVWPDKPLISSGPILGAAVYGSDRSGVPPGMIAESYWNFGLPGVLIIPLLCGAFFRILNDRWAPYARSSPTAAVVMAGVAVHPGIDMMANSIGSAPYQIIQTLILLVPVLMFVSTDTPPSATTMSRSRRSH